MDDDSMRDAIKAIISYGVEWPQIYGALNTSDDVFRDAWVGCVSYFHREIEVESYMRYETNEHKKK